MEKERKGRRAGNKRGSTLGPDLCLREISDRTSQSRNGPEKSVITECGVEKPPSTDELLQVAADS